MLQRVERKALINVLSRSEASKQRMLNIGIIREKPVNIFVAINWGGTLRTRKKFG